MGGNVKEEGAGGRRVEKHEREGKHLEQHNKRKGVGKGKEE